MRISAGTSGFSYKEWRGSFYPEGMKEADMLQYYAARFDTVELNNTFYRLPNEAALQSWAAQVPPGFRFSLKASRTITHIRRLKVEAAEAVEYLFRVTSVLGDARGPVLFGLPPNMKCDVERLTSFLSLVPPGARSAFEFRHESWLCDEVYDLLRSRGCALCIADTAEHTTPLVATTDWGYVRLRREEYTDADLAGWRQRIADQQWSDAFVYFKHEDAGTGPRLARDFLAL
ncbi:MAG TPA: DUF72 domain-containing protein [Longimicrobiales bacterium]|nr:DUF72 domain-containing protein [Longimicrobiales bacterium]